MSVRSIGYVWKLEVMRWKSKERREGGRREVLAYERVIIEYLEDFAD